MVFYVLIPFSTIFYCDVRVLWERRRASGTSVVLASMLVSVANHKARRVALPDSHKYQNTSKSRVCPQGHARTAHIPYS